MATTGTIPVYCRVGSQAEQQIGHIGVDVSFRALPGALASVLRAAADDVERKTDDTQPTTTREQQGSPRDRQHKPPRRTR